MISNKHTYTTHNNVHEADVALAPQGVDHFTDQKIHNIGQNEIKAYKNAHIQTAVMLINRKHKKIKG